MRISKATVDSQAPSAKPTFLWDSELRGFGIKINPSGSKTYIVQYRMGGRDAATRRHTIGNHGSPWTPTSARKEAERILLQCRSGIDPRPAKPLPPPDQSHLAFDRYVERFLGDYGRRNWRAGTLSNARSYFQRWATPVLLDRPVTEISRKDVTAVLDSIPVDNPALPRSVFAAMRKLMGWALERGDIATNPMASMTSPKSSAPRERVLLAAELNIIWATSLNFHGPYGALIRLLMLTGQRRDEVARMQWSEIRQTDYEWHLPEKRTKNGRAHVVPLSSSTVAELNRIGGADWPSQGYVITSNGQAPFSGYSKKKASFDQEMADQGNPVADWRLHDLRRTCATGLQKLGVRIEITEAILNHASGVMSGIAKVYQRYDWKEEKREALQQWDDYLCTIIGRP